MIAARSLLATVCAVLIGVPPLSAQAFTIRSVVEAGQPAPGGGNFEHFSIESLPIMAPLNGKRQVAFFATILRGPGSEGIFLASPSGIARVAVEGDRAPGGGTISGFGRHPIPAINDAGTVAFAAAITSGKTVEGIFTASRGRLQAVAVAGGAAPGILSGTFANLDAPALNDRGDLAFLATVRRGRETVEAVYVRARGKLAKIAAQGDPAPAGGLFAGFGPPAIDATGAVAFVAVVEGRAVPGGIFRVRDGQTKMLVGAGDDTPLGGIYLKFSERVAVNDAGLVAFHAVLKNASAPAAILVAEPSRVRKIAAIGDPAPGGGSLSHFGPWPAMNAQGTVAFAASVDAGPSPVAVFVTSAAGTATAAAIGDSLPGGKTLATLTLYPVVAVGPGDAVTFAAAPTPTGEGAEGIYLAAPSR